MQASCGLEGSSADSGAAALKGHAQPLYRCRRLTTWRIFRMPLQASEGMLLGKMQQ